MHGDHTFFDGLFLNNIGGRVADNQLLDGRAVAEHLVNAHSAFVAGVVTGFAPAVMSFPYAAYAAFAGAEVGCTQFADGRGVRFAYTALESLFFEIMNLLHTASFVESEGVM